jgi:hypothetical protein
MYYPTVCDEPMTEGQRIAGITSAQTPDSDGFLPLQTEDGQVPLTFTTIPRAVTQVKVKPPKDTNVDDRVTVTVTYINEDDESETPRVKNLFWHMYIS